MQLFLQPSNSVPIVIHVTIEIVVDGDGVTMSCDGVIVCCDGVMA